MGGLFGGGGQNIATSETRLGAIRFQTSAFGYPIPILYGQNRISGNLIWYGNFTPIAHTTTQSAGGKGGGGGTSSNTTYTYTTGLMIGLCEGQVAGIQRIWQGKNVMTLAQARLTQYVGAPGQAAWGFLTTSFAGQDLNYPNLAYVCSSNFDLGKMRYHSWFNPEWQQIEMYAVAEEDQTIRFPSAKAAFTWKRQQRILVEISRKFEPKRLQEQLGFIGLQPVAHYSDPQEWFSVLLLRK